MAVSSQATASMRQMYMGQPGTSATTLYTAPSASANVTAPSATAYIKEIIIANTTANAATITIGINGTAAANQIVPAVSVNGNDVKVLSGLNTAIPAGGTIQALQGTVSAITVTISGVEVQ